MTRKHRITNFYAASHVKLAVFLLVSLALSYIKLSQAAPAQQALLIASPLTKETCGGFDHRESYMLKSVGYSSRNEVSSLRQIFENEIRAKHGTRVKSESVYAGQCLVIARTQRRINGCQFVDFMWRTGVNAPSAEAALERDIRGISSSLIDWSVDKIQCIPVNKDTSFGIRG